MRVIDAHVHLYPEVVNRDPVAWATAAHESKWAELCTRRRKNGRLVQAFPSCDELLAEMDRAGVECSVLLGWYWEQAENCTAQNRFFAECVRAHPDRLAAFGTVQPASGAESAIAEMHRIHDAGLLGLGELSPHSQGYTVDDPAFRAVLELAAAWRLPVNLHVTDPDSRPYPGRVETPLADFVALARRFPEVNFVLAHWGGLLPLRDAEAARLGNLYYDTAASPLLYDENIWAQFVAVVPVERVWFGSDFPLNLYPRLDATPSMARLIAEAERAGGGEKILADNASQMLRLGRAR